MLQVQKIFHIMDFKHKQERLTFKQMSVSAVVSMYNAKLPVKAGEAFSASFVDSASVVWETILKHVPLQRLVVAAEEFFGNKTPFDSVYKLELVARKADRDVGKITWMLDTIVDLVLNHGVEHGDLTVVSLKGITVRAGRGSPCQRYLEFVFELAVSHRLQTCKQQQANVEDTSQLLEPTNCCRLLDLMLIKKDAAHHCLTNLLDLLAVSADEKAALRKVLSSVVTLRAAMGLPHFDEQAGLISDRINSGAPDWHAGLGKVALRFAEFVEARRQ